MKFSWTALCLCVAASVLALTKTAAPGWAADGELSCALDTPLPLDETIGICGLVINSTAGLRERVGALIVRAELRLKQDDPGKAIEDCGQAIDLDPLSTAA